MAAALVPLDEIAETRIVELLGAALGPGAVERSPAYWRWKHAENPFGRSPGLAAVAGDELVALRVFMRWRWRAGERTVPALRAVDTATRPDWRRRGLFRRLTLGLIERLADEGAAFVFNTPNRTSRAGYLTMGWRDAGRPPLLVRPRRPLRMLAALLRTGAARSSAASPPPAPLRPVGELLAEPELPGFLARWSRGEERLHTPRDAAYLRWRYDRVPGLSYGALWELDGESGALAVGRLRERRGLRELALAELLVSDDAAGRRAGARLAATAGRVPGVDHAVAMAASGRPERRALLAGGFLPARRLAPRLVVRPLPAAGAADAPDVRHWCPSVGDLELF